VSDFQTGVLDSAAVASVPSSVGIEAVAIPVRTNDAPLDRRFAGKTDGVARIGFANGATNVAWTAGSQPRADSEIEIHAADSSAAAAVFAASQIVGVDLPIDTAARIAVVFAGAPDRDALARRSSRVTSPRLIDLVARVRVDSLLGSTRGTAVRGAIDTTLSRLGPAVISDLSGNSVATAAEDTTSGARRLLVFSNDDVGSVRSAALIAALRRALSLAPPAGELDPSTISTATLASWRRAPSAAPTREHLDSANGPSDGRWLWAFVLALLGVESWLRRERRVAAVSLEERVRDRAA